MALKQSVFRYYPAGKPVPPGWRWIEFLEPSRSKGYGAILKEDEVKKDEFLDEVKDIVQARQMFYGKPEVNHQRIADIWSVLLNREISATEVAICMIGLKMARLAEGPHLDSFRDIAGYAAVAAEIQFGDDDVD